MGQISGLADYDAVVRLRPEDPTAYYYRGLHLKELARHEGAIEDLGEAIRLDPKYLPPYVARGLAYSSLDRNFRAIDDLDTAISMDPQNPNMYAARGQIFNEVAWLAQLQTAYDGKEKAAFDQAVGEGFDQDGGISHRFIISRGRID